MFKFVKRNLGMTLTKGEIMCEVKFVPFFATFMHEFCKLIVLNIKCIEKCVTLKSEFYNTFNSTSLL